MAWHPRVSSGHRSPADPDSASGYILPVNGKVCPAYGYFRPKRPLDTTFLRGMDLATEGIR